MRVLSRHLNTKALMLFSQGLARALGAGIPMLRALNLVGQRRGKTRELRRGLQDAIERGQTFEQALRAQSVFLPPHVIEMLSAADRAGRLAESLNELTAHLEQRLDVQRAFWKQVTYPLAVGVACFVIIPFARDYVIRSINRPDDAGFTRYALHYLAGWLPTLATFAVIVVLARLGVFRPIGHWCSVYFPPVRFFTKKIVVARFLHTAAVLLDSHVPLREAILRAAAATDNPWLIRDLTPAVAKIQRGVTFTQAFAGSRHLPTTIQHMIDVGEISGSLPEMLRKAAEWNVNDAYHRARIVIQLLEALLIVSIGIAIVM